MDNLNLNEILKKLSSMSKSELEENLKKAQHILNNSNINISNENHKQK